MNYREFIDWFAKRHHLTKQTSRILCDAFTEDLIFLMKNRVNFNLKNCGKFDYPETRGRTRIRFTATPKLRNDCNQMDNDLK